MQCLRRSWELPNNLKHNEARFDHFDGFVVLTSPYISKCGDLVLTNKQTDGQN
jgi:hypothetical protein